MCQAGTDRVGEDVGRLMAQVFVVSQRVVKVTRLPERPAAVQLPIHQQAAARLEPLHAATEGAVSELHQPMHMVRDHHPGEVADRLFLRQRLHYLRHVLCQTRLPKVRDTGMDDARQCIDVAYAGVAAMMEAWAGHAIRMWLA
jgi:hypothetical protein